MTPAQLTPNPLPDEDDAETPQTPPASDADDAPTPTKDAPPPTDEDAAPCVESTSSCRGYGDDVASMAWGVRNLISTQAAPAKAIRRAKRSYTPPPNKPTSVHLSPTASSRQPKTVGMPKAPIEYAHEIKQCTFSPRVRETASFLELRGDGVRWGKHRSRASPRT